MQVGVINESDTVRDPDVALWVDAWDRQLVDICKAWNVKYTPTIFYARGSVLPVANGQVRLMTIQDKLNVPGASGYHTNVFGLVYSRLLVEDDVTVTGSHEDGEMVVNPYLDRWVRMPDGREAVEEISDPCQGDTYMQQAKIGPIKRDIAVSNFVYPSYFRADGKPPYDHMRRISRPFEIRPGGYQVVRDAAGTRVSIFAKPYVIPGSPDAYPAIAKKLTRPESTLTRLLRA